MEIIEEVNRFCKENQDMHIEAYQDGSFTIEGIYHLDVEHEGFQAHKDFAIRISVPKDYPKRFPLIQELNGDVPSSFNHKYKDQSLCLEVEIALSEWLQKDSSLINFCDQFLVNYLFSVVYFEKYQIYPHGQRRHGNLGIVDYYIERFNVNEMRELLNLLRYLSKTNSYQSLYLCACGSGKRIKNCHGQLLKSYFSSKSLMGKLREDFKIIEPLCLANIVPHSKDLE